MSCQCYANKKNEQTCGILKDGYLYGCTKEKCNEGVGCTSFIAPYGTANTVPPNIKTPILWFIVILMVIISTLVSFIEA